MFSATGKENVLPHTSRLHSPSEVKVTGLQMRDTNLTDGALLRSNEKIQI
jgi:hypothetical protein